MGEQKQRTAWLDVAKGLGIILVVIGHLVARDAPPDHQWWMAVKSLLYSFHMPFFMAVSGYTCFAFTKPWSGWSRYGNYVWKRFDRLMIPLILFALAIYFGKMYSARHMAVDNVVKENSRPWDILTDPMNSYSIFLWYVWVLFLFSLLVPSLVKLGTKVLWGIFGLAAAGYVAHFLGYWHPQMIFRVLVLNFPFFMIGGLLSRSHTQWNLGKWGTVCGVVWVALAVVSLRQTVTWPLVLGMAISGCFFCLYAAMLISGMATQSVPKFLSWVGVFAFPIYLMNTAAIGLSKGLLGKLLSWDGSAFTLFLVVMFLSGLFLPIFLQTQIIERLPVLRRLLRR